MIAIILIPGSFSMEQENEVNLAGVPIWGACFFMCGVVFRAVWYYVINSIV
jgi:hypothetical protein